ncbi:hypothetical protein EV424DRAFT_1297075, partial [Suillus variegatus]
SLKWTRSQLFLRSHLSQRGRGVNSWNGFIKAKLREENEDCERGDRIKLTQFIADNKDELLEAYSRLTFAQRHAYNAEVLEARAQKRHIARANPKAKHHDINATFIGMDHEVSQGLILSYYVDFLVDENTMITRQRPLNKLISDCRTIIQEELESIALKKNIKKAVKMNYINYERSIVEHCGVALVG